MSLQTVARHIGAASQGTWADFPMAHGAEQILSMKRNICFLVIQANMIFSYNKTTFTQQISSVLLGKGKAT